LKDEWERIMLQTRAVAVMMFQSSDLSRHDIHLAMIFLAIIALALVVQAVGVVISGGFAAKLLHRVDGIANIVEKRTGPMLDKTNALLDELSPKVKAMVSNTEQISETVRVKVEELAVTVGELNDTVKEINGRTRVQVARADGLVTDALVATSEISHSVTESIKVPVRQIAGLVAGAKAGLETLIARSPFGNKRGPGSYDL
jgi:methyl-accepting chemotaxis protein